MAVAQKFSTTRIASTASVRIAVLVPSFEDRREKNRQRYRNPSTIAATTSTPPAISRTLLGAAIRPESSSAESRQPACGRDRPEISRHFVPIRFHPTSPPLNHAPLITLRPPPAHRIDRAHGQENEKKNETARNKSRRRIDDAAREIVVVTNHRQIPKICPSALRVPSQINHPEHQERGKGENRGDHLIFRQRRNE